jgi:diguanylate cyclase (GGDEF)-like protein
MFWAVSGLLMAAPVPALDAQVGQSNGDLSLAGPWGIAWGRWVPLDQVRSGDLSVDIVELPNYLVDLPITGQTKTGQTKTDSIVQGHGTYLLQLDNLDAVFGRPTLSMRYARDAWQAWWVDRSGAVQLLGESGQIALKAEDQQFRNKAALLKLPNTSQSGTLVIYLSTYHANHAGLYGEFTIREHDTTLRIILTDLAARTFLIAVGIYVTIQNLVFFFRRRQETTLLLLAIFSGVSLSRAAFSSGYVDYFVAQPDWSLFFYKVEYLLIFWPAIAGLQLLLSFFPLASGRRIVALTYGFFALAIVLTMLAPMFQVTLHLWAYQLALLLFTTLCLLAIIRGLVLGMPDARHFLLSATPLMLAVINDVLAGQLASYNLYVTEYALFLFLFVQTQIQSARFVDALKTSEHLSKNLTEEVALKTRQLRLHNDLLTEKAEDLLNQNDEIRLIAETDHLTGLLNRQTLDKLSELQFQLALGYRQPLALVMMDLDHFKAINDTYGHLVGDECLIFVASFLRGFKLRKRDIIARFGGEEMVILLADTDLEMATQITQELCDSLALTPVTGDHPDITLSASFGIAELNQSQAVSVHQLIGFADHALYQAKRLGRNRVEAYSPVRSDDRLES